jgi:hypothetical protein
VVCVPTGDRACQAEAQKRSFPRWWRWAAKQAFALVWCRRRRGTSRRIRLD